MKLLYTLLHVRTNSTLTFMIMIIIITVISTYTGYAYSDESF